MRCLARLWRYSVIPAILLTALPPSAHGHDLWLIPEANAESGKAVLVHANSGMEFPKSEQAPDPAAFQKRIWIGADGSRHALEAAGQSEKSGLLRFQPATTGTYIVAVETKPKLITLDAASFNEYLVADGLPHIYRLRAKEKLLDQPARERYSKYPKALIRIGSGLGDPCRPIGLALEIVPLHDPFLLERGDTLRVRVLFRGTALEDANLGWDVPGDGEAPSGTVRTDKNGEALIPIARNDLMTIRLTHMTRATADDHEWESFWTTLTFRIPN